MMIDFIPDADWHMIIFPGLRWKECGGVSGFLARATRPRGAGDRAGRLLVHLASRILGADVMATLS